MHQGLLAALVRNAISEARVATDRYGLMHSFHTEVLVHMGTVSFKIVMAFCAAAATLAFGVLQLLNANTETSSERRIDKAVQQRTTVLEERFVDGLDQAVGLAVATALAKKFITEQNNKDHNNKDQNNKGPGP
jgi:hypothetical protein